MNTIRVDWKALLLASVLLATTASAQVTRTSITAPDGQTIGVQTPKQGMGAIKDTSITPTAAQTATVAAADSLPDTHLDNAVAALDKGDKTASAKELQTGIAGLEADAQKSKTSFKDKVVAQVGKLKALLPLIAGGGLSSGILGKAVGLAKLASGGNRLEGLLSAGSLIGKGSQLTSGLSGLGSAMSVLGGGASTGQSLISSALGSVGKLDQGGLAAKAAEPAAKSQIGSVLNFVKGAL